MTLALGVLALGVSATLALAALLAPARVPAARATIAQPSGLVADPRPSGASQPPLEPPSTSVHLELAATPEHARIEIDGTTLARNPYTAVVPKDDVKHAVVISATGYETYRGPLMLERDLQLHVSLAPQALSEPPSATPSRRRRARGGRRPSQARERPVPPESTESIEAAAANREGQPEATVDSVSAGQPLERRDRGSVRTIDEEDPYR